MAKQDETDAASASTTATSTDDSKKSDDKKAASTATPATSVKAAGAGSMMTDGIDLLKADHRKAEALFEEYKSAAPARKTAIIQEVCAELIMHTRLEEEIFYPACREAAADEEPLNEAQVEHDGAKLLIADLLAGDPNDPYRDAKLKVLSEQIKHHVAEEEKPGSGIFAKARAAGVDAAALGEKLRRRKDELKAKGGRSPQPTPLVALELDDLSIGQNKEDPMARQQGGRDRDEQGRFTSDDRGRSRGRDDEDRGYRSRGRDDDDGRGWYGDSEGHSEASRRGWAARRGGESRSFRDDDDRGYRSRSNERERDEYGRFVSDDDRGGYRSRGRDDDDRGYRSNERERDEYGRFTSDDDRGGYRSRGRDDDRDGRGRGGWFGDSEGHARAARERWEDDDRGYRSRGGDDRDRDERGRFVSDDDRGYRSRGRDDDDRGGRGRGGWFGDSEGHARAARQRWEEDDRGSRSRGRDDDDRGGGRGRGGWFGDSEGHAEAARRGWEDRR